MRILIIDWLLMSLALFGFYYFVDKAQKREAAKWTSRFAWCGTVSAVILMLIVFLERL
jgi:hypothetical protein